MTRRDGPTLAERVGAVPLRTTKEGTSRHCWVLDAPGHPGQWPGLLLEWRRTDEGWLGRVAYAIGDPDQPGARLVERWLDSTYLRSA